MAPSAITEDYYMILEVDQTAALQLIVSSYRRLALKLHPDKNVEHDTTEAFQKIGRAYETLKDEDKRRTYDLIYPSLRRRSSPQPSQTPHPPPKPASQSEYANEGAQIAALQRQKQERNARWWTNKNAFDSLIFELQRRVRRLEAEMKGLDFILAAEAAEEARKNSWGAWLLSPILKKAEDSEEEKERKNRDRQERRIEKDMKERRMDSTKADLKMQEDLLRKAKEEMESANRNDDYKIRVIQARILARGEKERKERERQERERLEKERQEREKKDREEMERRRQQQREEWERRRHEMEEAYKKQQDQWERVRREAAEATERQQEEERAFQKAQSRNRGSQRQHAYQDLPTRSTPQAYEWTCSHDGWWPKVHIRAQCPECSDTWTYLLQCPGCQMMACPKCQAALRPRKSRHGPRMKQRANQRVRTPSPIFDWYD